MSALLFHGLIEETRPDAHYLTYPVPSKRRKASRPPSPTRTDQSGSPSSPRTGTQVLTLGGLPFRMRSMSENRLFGVVRRYTAGQAEVSIFDRERSLLFCLSDPSCNGGLRGMLEAWQVGSDEVREDKVLQYLGRLDSPATWRRAGLVAERFGLEQLRQGCLDVVQELPIAEERELHLVGPLGHGRLFKPWMVKAPW